MSENTTVELDFTDVKDFGNPARNVDKGNYLLKVQSIEKQTSKAGNPMWVVTAEFVEGAHQGETLREYLALTEKALFKVKSWLDAVHGQTLPKKKIKLPNTTPELQKKFGGRVYGAHIDDGDPRTDSNGNTVVYPEIKYHMLASVVKDAKESASETVTDSTPTEEPKEAPAKEESTDTAGQLEAFDLDSL